MMTGQALKFLTAPGTLRVTLARPIVGEGGQARIRVRATIADPRAYSRARGPGGAGLAADGEVIFTQVVTAPRNAVVLPTGWYCTFSAAPATVSQLPDGRVRLDYWNDRPQAVEVLLKARRRTGT